MGTPIAEVRITTAEPKAGSGNGCSAQHEADALIATIIAQHKEANALVRKMGGIQHHMTDLGNAERFVQAWGQDVLYDHTAGCWLLFDGRRYQPDETDAIFHLARATVRAIYSEAAFAEDLDTRRVLATWAKASESAMRQRALLDLARSDPIVAVTFKEVDADQWILNVINGTLDLRNGELCPHRREDRLTRLAPVAYDPQAVPARFLAFLEDITLGRADLQAFLQRYLGYSLTGSTREQCFAIFWGGGYSPRT